MFAKSGCMVKIDPLAVYLFPVTRNNLRKIHREIPLQGSFDIYFFEPPNFSTSPDCLPLMVKLGISTSPVETKNFPLRMHQEPAASPARMRAAGSILNKLHLNAHTFHFDG